MKKFIIPMIIGSFLVSGCSSSNTEQSNEEHKDSHNTQAQPTLKYVLGSNDWSSITSLTDNPEILEAYQFAVEHPEVLNYMPCYCGCYEEDGHTSNTNCFVDKVDDKVATLDTMGFGWQVCVDIAREAKLEFEKGTPLKEIRENIDEKYKNGGTPPTPTPVPKA